MLLCTYPARLRADFGIEILQLFADQLADARQRHSTGRLYARTLLGLVADCAGRTLFRISSPTGRRQDTNARTPPLQARSGLCAQSEHCGSDYRWHPRLAVFSQTSGERASLRFRFFGVAHRRSVFRADEKIAHKTQRYGLPITATRCD